MNKRPLAHFLSNKIRSKPSPPETTVLPARRQDRTGAAPSSVTYRAVKQNEVFVATTPYNDSSD